MWYQVSRSTADLLTNVSDRIVSIFNILDVTRVTATNIEHRRTGLDNRATQTDV